MQATVIEWDGTHVPEELRKLPPGRYIVEVMDDVEQLSPEEDAAVRLGLDELEAGEILPLEDVVREIRARATRE